MKGLDLSFSEPPAQWWHDRRDEGYEVMVQCVWTGGFASNDGIKAVAETNLRNARLAGFRVAAYANASPPDWWPLVTQMTHIRANMGGEWDRVKDVVIDVEIPGITKARVMELADGLEAVGKVCDVLYTGRWFWVGHMGNSKDPAWRRFRLWSAHYDWNPDIDFGNSPYGPWTLAEVIGEQYQGSTNVAGGTVDLNTFMDSWMAPPAPTPEPTPEPSPIEEDIMGKIADSMKATGLEIERQMAAATKGAKGDRGATGATGATGPQGPAGKDATGGTAQRTYTVQSGDSLSAIANKYSGVTWQQIYAANKAVIGSDPDLIQKGMVLVIP